ncbi:hypothetical protein E3P77_00905 [Wallemia ichthyophaga]|nr:hypothetical protein E3P77_00905 [Wallemia ichthyophaga]
MTTTTTTQQQQREQHTQQAQQPQQPPPNTPAQPSHTHSRPSTKARMLGDYVLGKTLGAGSMGKVKIGVHVLTGEKVAIKIIPRFTSTNALNSIPPNQPKPTQSFINKAHNKDLSKEVRTVREASICLLLFHPFICGMREMSVYSQHYYMLNEFVNGGQMLDYIISHGRLKERSARSFARQISSALSYCHANSIVHRDLKIENILISKTGNIKIIDFGLSNIWSPHSNLNTFCGSLYFAAPELLNARAYSGPEVDIWSFGIVLYVLVAGKVPFDDQSMPALHAKIKRGHVDYPAWLSTECKSLLSSMLVTNPLLRASLNHVSHHPWMIKGHSGPPHSHIPPRQPLRPDITFDPQVIKGMMGFEFGNEYEIEHKLRQVLNSPAYLNSLAEWDKKNLKTSYKSDPELNNYNNDLNAQIQHTPHHHRRFSQQLNNNVEKDLPTSISADNTQRTSRLSKRFSGLDFYKRKIAGTSIANAFTSINDQTQIGEKEKEPKYDTSKPYLNPTQGFHPLISIYFLVSEKQQRDKNFGPGLFASSQVSLATMANQAHAQVHSPVTPSDHSVYAQYERNRPPPPVAPIPLPLSQSDEEGMRRSTSNSSMMPVARQRLSSTNSRARPLTISEYTQGTNANADHNTHQQHQQLYGQYSQYGQYNNYSQYPPAQQPTPVPNRVTSNMHGSGSGGVNGSANASTNASTVVRSPSSPAMNNSRQHTRARANPLDVGTAAPIQPPPPVRDGKDYPLPPPAASAHRRSHSLSQKPEMSPPLPPANSSANGNTSANASANASSASGAGAPMSTINEPDTSSTAATTNGTANGVANAPTHANGKGGIAHKFTSFLHRQSSHECAPGDIPRQRVNSTNSYRTANRLSMLTKSSSKDREGLKEKAHNDAVNKLEGGSHGNGNSNAHSNGHHSPNGHRRAYTVSEQKREHKSAPVHHDRTLSSGQPKATTGVQHTVGRYSGVGPWIQSSNKKSAQQPHSHQQQQQLQPPGTPTALEVMSRSSSRSNGNGSGSGNANGNENGGNSTSNTSQTQHTRQTPEEVFDPVEEPKAVWGKGLFSVATTSTKSSNTLRSEIGDTLSRLGVSYRFTRAGFECTHQPSISVGGAGSKRLEGSVDYSLKDKGDSSEHMKFGKFVRKKSSKMSFNSSKKASNHDLGEEVGNGSGSGSGNGNGNNPSASKVRFEINIVRVPLLLGINGIQFRRITGNSWSYKAVAQRVLGEMQL